MLNLSYSRNLLFILILIYFLQGILYSQGSLISQSALGLIYAVSGYFFIKVQFQRKKKSSFIKLWTALLLINIIGFVFTADYTNHLGMFKGILMCLLTFYPFYYFAQKGYLKRKNLIYFLAVMLPISIVQFYFNREMILSEATSDNINVVNNIAYNFVSLIPFLFLIRKNKILSFAGLFVLLLFVIQGAKRGAILIGSVGLLSYIYYQMRMVDKKNRIKGYLIIGIAALFLGYFAYDMFITNEYLLRRVELTTEGYSSGRDRIYANVFSGWYNSNNIIHYLFGFGFAGSQQFSGSGHFAHNDWLELLSNFGLIGFVIYLLFFYYAYQTIRKSSWHFDKKLLFGTIMIMWFLTTLFSMGYTSMGGYIYAIIIGYLMGDPNKNLI